ncbi:ubiquinol-cytochrome c reductase iron-sulfur subunit [Aquisalimonas lutea]|uniref:ubiquinol-cytochrome c reductase iron-sulfur subunit n=1 Tax=Aquisalimonas lutea TaxID=1327750 RepID=UPI0025B3BCA2|nr:ubiquinol-cytochrome c reductase iron-sulfur subunit [Aquisalimonas lutea]MDN3517395.1 ubiquinol-cytochrome c reductase iron-sulfur subunit [Aquisalimonas lutea]
MNQEGADKSRRRFLTAATSVVGGVGAAFLAVPFIAYWRPSARAQAAGAPVEVDISGLEPGQLINVKWRGNPVWLFRRSEEQLEELDTIEDVLRDPDSSQPQQPEYAQNQYRSIKPEIMVLVGICTHLGCSPLYRPEEKPEGIDDKWVGGFFCPCHGSYFDLAGRVYQGVPAPLNLEVPPYYFIDDSTVLVGEDEEGAA